MLELARSLMKVELSDPAIGAAPGVDADHLDTTKLYERWNDIEFHPKK